MVTIQEFITELGSTAFSDAAKQDVMAMLSGQTELTPELHEKAMARLEQEIEADLKDVPLTPEDALAIDKEVEEELALIEQNATEAVQQMESQLRELDEMEQKVDVLERLHSSQ
jgi:hypothetical protein